MQVVDGDAATGDVEAYLVVLSLLFLLLLVLLWLWLLQPQW